MFRSSVFFTVLCLGASASASDFASRSTPGVGEEFGLYAYGDSIGGLSLFYGDGKIWIFTIWTFTTIQDHIDEVLGKALIGDPANSTAPNTSSVSCKYILHPAVMIMC